MFGDSVRLVAFLFFILFKIKSWDGIFNANISISNFRNKYMNCN